MAFNKMNAHTNPIFIQLDFLNIEDIRQLQLLSFVYDCLNKTASVFFHDHFTPSSERHNFNTRLASDGDRFLEGKKHFSIWYKINWVQWYKTLEHASCCSQRILFSISLSVRFEKIPLMYAYQLNVFIRWSSSLLNNFLKSPPFLSISYLMQWLP